MKFSFFLRSHLVIFYIAVEHFIEQNIEHKPQMKKAKW